MKVLYISYDGMTDPLGSSQVIPYLIGLAGLGHGICILSFEKEKAYQKSGQGMHQKLRDVGIRWQPLRYHARPPVISTLKDIRSGLKMAKQLQCESSFEIIHARSYISALIALRMKKKSGIPFIFDMRGFWADERVEGGLWKLSNPVFKAVYRFFKRREKAFFSESAAVVSLTTAGKEVILSRALSGVNEQKIRVIPCCTDTDLFSPIQDKEKQTPWRNKLQIRENTRVISYLGSFGTWYMADEMLDFFHRFLKTDPEAIFLIITKESQKTVLDRVVAKGISPASVRITPAEREEVPCLLSLSSYTLFFIRPTFSKKASSPTKMGEALSMGIPVICNNGIGDCTPILEENRAGVIVPAFDEASYDQAIAQLQSRKMPDAAEIRNLALRYFDLRSGVASYHEIYSSISK